MVGGDQLHSDTGEVQTKFYAAPKIKTQQGKIQHSSFLQGGNVKSAGMLEVNKEGQFISIRNQSGHYRPSQKEMEMAYLIKHLKEANFDISKIHVTYTKHQIFNFISSTLKINMKWGSVNQRGDIWFEKTEKN